MKLNVVILAGGKGTRMREMTEDLPANVQIATVKL